MMIDNALYQSYFTSLLTGDKKRCLAIVQDLLEKNIEIRELYAQLFQRSMYKIGELWEANEISVAREHLATSITERMLNACYPYTFTGRDSGKKVLVACAINEHHQLGGKMVADIFEIHGWDSQFLGTNTPIKELLSFADEIKPELIALSFAVSSNLSVLKVTVEAIQAEFGDLDIFVVGQAFIWAGTDILKEFPGIHYIETLAHLEEIL